jgi:hypothetical protein
MSDTQTQSYTPAQKTSRRTMSVWVWLLVLVVSLGALSAAVWWVGGPAQAMDMLGVSNLSLSSLGIGGSPSSSGGNGGALKTPSTPKPSVASTLPADAQERMFSEQVESHVALSDLVGGRISEFKLGKPEVAEASATVPLTATYFDGSAVAGTLTLAKFDGLWYFFSLGRTGGEGAKESADTPNSFDSGVVATITHEQAQSGTQGLISKGILDGGFTVVKVDAVHPGPRTATIDVTLSDGTSATTKGQLVCISKTDGATTYWFVASFEKR